MHTHRLPVRSGQRWRSALLAGFATITASIPAHAAPKSGDMEIPVWLEANIGEVTPRVIAWRRDIHQNPELGNHESRTAALVAHHLRALGLEVHERVAVTGVVGILRGAKPGPVVALRADMDALPILEKTGLPFASKAVFVDGDKRIPVMHACGHDAHTAMLMGAAEVLSRHREDIAGTVMFIFQPSEEGAHGDEFGGAPRMLKEGVFDILKPDAIFALHVEPGKAGHIETRSGALLSASSDVLIDLAGRQTHGGRPWEGTDTITLLADVIKSISTITSRQVNVFASPSVVSIGSVQAGTRVNIIPGTASLKGTMRTFDPARREQLKTLIHTSVQGLARTYGGTAKVTFIDNNEAVINDDALLQRIAPALEAAAGAPGFSHNAMMRGAAEDFSAFTAQVPGVYYILGSTPSRYADIDGAPTNHSDLFDIDESVLSVGVRAHVLTVLRFLDSGTSSGKGEK